MLTKIETDFYEHSTRALVTLSEEIKKLREAVEKCTGRSLPDSQEVQAKEDEQPKYDCLAVTKVDVFPFKEGLNLGRMKALATVVINDQFFIRGLRVTDGENGLFILYPMDPFYKGEESICFPLTRELREHIENCVLEKYQAVIA